MERVEKRDVQTVVLLPQRVSGGQGAAVRCGLAYVHAGQAARQNISLVAVELVSWGRLTRPLRAPATRSPRLLLRPGLKLEIADRDCRWEGR